MADVKFYIPVLRTLEGALSDDQYDTAAAHMCPYFYFGKQYHTSCGILWTLWAQEVGVTPDSAERWFKMSDEDLAFIVSKVFWTPIRCAEINSQIVANSIMDWEYNSGEGIAIRHVQGVLGITADGICGNGTLAAINAKEPNTLYSEIMAVRRAFFEAQNNPKEITGWLHRIDILNNYNASIIAQI